MIEYVTRAPHTEHSDPTNNLCLRQQIEKHLCTGSQCAQSKKHFTRGEKTIHGNVLPVYIVNKIPRPSGTDDKDWYVVNWFDYTAKGDTI